MKRLVLVTEIIAPYRVPVFNALAKHPGIDLHVIFLSENDPTLRQWNVPKDEIRFSHEVLSSYRKRLAGYHLLVNWGVTSALERARPDAILCGGYNYIASWECLRFAQLQRIPFLLWVESTARDQRNGRSLVESFKRAFLRRCSGFVVPGKASREYLRSFGVAEHLIFTAPNAVDVAFYSRQAETVRTEQESRRRGLNLPQRYFLYLGRMVPEKGVFDLISAYGTLSSQTRTNLGLVMVGDGPARAELESRAAAFGQNGVRFAGFAQRDAASAYYGLADAFILPTHSDTWGLVVNEAMACGLPVIVSSAAGCVSDLVDEGWNGRVTQPGNISQLAVAMENLVQNEALRVEMGKHSRQRIAGFTPEACAAGIAAAAEIIGVTRRG